MASNSLLYNKYRPQRFDEVAGNEQVTDLLKAILANNEIANTHYIFSGCVTADTPLKVRVRSKPLAVIPTEQVGSIMSTREEVSALLSRVKGLHYVYEIFDLEDNVVYVGVGFEYSLLEDISNPQQTNRRLHDLIRTSNMCGRGIRVRVDSVHGSELSSLARRGKLMASYANLYNKPSDRGNLGDYIPADISISHEVNLSKAIIPSEANDLGWITLELPIFDLMRDFSSGYEVEVDSPDGWVPVVEFKVKGIKQCYEVTTENGVKVKASHNHLFEVSDKVYMAARNLSTSDMLRVSGRWVGVKSVVDIGQHAVYDLTVGHENERYYAGGISGHNSPGTGKTTSAKILARAINCISREPDGEPCNKCDRCTAFLAGKYADYMELDGTQYNKVEDAKRLVDLASQYPITPGGYRVIMIDEAHALSNQAFDKFLLLLESADVKTIFIFSTTDLHLFRPAIVSRCFSFTITPLNSKQIAGELNRICKAEGIEYTQEAINKMAYQFTGKPRDAVKTLDLYLRAYGKLVEYNECTQETIMLDLLKKAYFNKVEEYQESLDKLNPSYIFRTLSRTLNEVFFYPNLAPILLSADDVEGFKNLVEITSLKQLIRDSAIFKPDDPYSLSLFLTQVSEIGLKLRTKSEARASTLGRRFVDKNPSSQVADVVKPTQRPTPEVIIEVDNSQGTVVDLDDVTPVSTTKPTPALPENTAETVLAGHKENKALDPNMLMQFGFTKKGA